MSKNHSSEEYSEAGQTIMVASSAGRHNHLSTDIGVAKKKVDGVATRARGDNLSIKRLTIYKGHSNLVI
ncbi:hypothetical protein SUGI_0070680 [Cryptomeria japonica]|nr:hypothetical protein SUGI_0070680 [Cryptomeria japonica]